MKDHFLKTTIPLTVIGGLNLCFGLFFQALIAGIYGAGSDLDAFLIANAITGFLNNWLLWGAANIVLVPLLTSDADKNSEQANTFITALGLMALLFGLFCFLFAPFLVPYLAPGFNAEQIHRCTRVLQMLSVTVFLTAVVSSLRGILNANSIYVLPYGFLTLYNLFLIAFVLAFAEKTGIWALTAGTVLATGVFCLCHFFPLKHVRFHYRPRFRWSLLRGPMKIFFSYMLVGIASQSNFLADRYFASRLPEGSIVILSLAQKFQIPIIYLFVFAVSVPALTLFSNTLESRDKFCHEIRNSIRSLTLMVVPFIALLVVLRVPLSRFWLQHGKFTHAEVLQVGSVILWFSSAFLVNAYSSLLVNGFFVLRKTTFLILVVFAESALNILLDRLLVGPMGLNGIALATSLSTVPANILLWGALRSRLKGLGFQYPGEVLRLVAWCVSCLLVVIFSAGVVSMLGGTLDGSSLVSVFTVVAVSLPCIVLLGVIFRIEEILQILSALKNRLWGPLIS
jgi:putative peptidoglycan lipid II flippase